MSNKRKCFYRIMTVTFVSTFQNIYNNEDEEKFKDRMAYFLLLLKLGIHIVLFIPEPFATILLETIQTENLKVHLRIIKNPIQNVSGENVVLPTFRNVEKDTFSFLNLMNMKVQFVKMAIDLNFWPNDSHYAWIDFSVAKIFKQPLPTLEDSWRNESDEIQRQSQSTLGFLQYLGNQATLNNTCIVSPGCWPQSNATITTQEVHWRFCGGFVLGNRASFLEWHQLHEKYYSEFTGNGSRITWEVNFWAWLEQQGHFQPKWYSADHNDSLITAFPNAFFTNSPHSKITEIHNSLQSSCPFPFHPSSIAHIVHQGKEWLNIRAINYHILPDHSYHIVGKMNKIMTLNLTCSQKNEQRLVTVQEWSNDRQEDPITYGLEDLRLWHDAEQQVRCIGTNIDHTRNNIPQIVVGHYDLDRASINQIYFPTQNEMQCEKNWAPFEGTNRYVYKWSADFVYTGNIDGGAVSPVPIPRPNHLYSNWRGSTVFLPIKSGDEFIGVVHYSDELEDSWRQSRNESDELRRHSRSSSRVYYHVLVKIGPSGLLLEHTDPFYFVKRQIEFCTGYYYRKEDNVHQFWVSQMDSAPVYIEIEDSEFNWHRLLDDEVNYRQ